MSGLQHVTEVSKLLPRSSDSHRGTFGKLLVVAGSGGMAGAAVLCARAATRSGAGLVRVGLHGALLASGLEPFDAACLAVHVHGRTGDRARVTLGENGMAASDLVDAIAQELR